MASLLRSLPNVTVPKLMILLQIPTAIVSIFCYLSSTNSDYSNLVLVDVEKYTDYVHVRQLSREWEDWEPHLLRTCVMAQP